MRAKIDTRPGAWSSWWAVGDFLDVPWPKNGEIDIMDAFQGRGGSRVVPVRCLSLTLSQPCFDPPGNIFKSALVGDMLVPRSVSHLCRLSYFSCSSSLASQAC